MNTQLMHGFTATAPNFPSTAWAAINWPVDSAGNVQTQGVANQVSPTTHAGGGLFYEGDLVRGNVGTSVTLNVVLKSNNDTYIRTSATVTGDYAYYERLGSLILYTWDNYSLTLPSNVSANEFYLTTPQGLKEIMRAAPIRTLGGMCRVQNSVYQLRVTSRIIGNTETFCIGLVNPSNYNSFVLSSALPTGLTNITGAVLLWQHI